VSEATTLIHNAIVVLPDRVLDGGAVRLADGLIAEIAERRTGIRGSYARAVDAGGAYLMPGIIDLHNDSLETEINPRPETDLPVEFAISNLERRLLASGVTTEFHAMAFMEMPRNRRTVQNAGDRAAFIARWRDSGRALVDHHILHRVDVWTPGALDTVFESMRRFPAPYLSLNDHTPGQGQYRDLNGYIERMRAWTEARGGQRPTEADVQARIAARAADTVTIPSVYARVREEAAGSQLVIASHDDDSPAKVDTMWEVGARVAEFPVTFDAAQRARDRGMWIVVGAPNIVRGGSSSGNQDARELFAHGLADIICADYHAPSLLHSVFRVVDEGLLDLPGAVRTLTVTPARAVGLRNVGAIRTGWRADLLLVRLVGGVPEVEAVYRDGHEVYVLRIPIPEGVAS
jgi:alpha-D-ribose 1-methylphosphonate 5-triphosphate diphosphatase